MRHAALSLATLLLIGAWTALASAAVMFIPQLDSTAGETRKAKLAQMAVLVNELSEGRSSLMLKSQSSADPKSGIVFRSIDEQDNSFFTVYPASTPLSTRMLVTTGENGVVRQYGRILGAVEVITRIGGIGDPNKADADAYLLFVPINGPINSEMPIWLVSLSVDDDGRVTHNVAAQSTVKLSSSRLGPKDAPPLVKAAIDFIKAPVSITWKDYSYSFSFEMDIFYGMPEGLWFVSRKASA